MAPRPVSSFPDAKNAGFSALRNYSHGDADAALDSIRTLAVSLAGEVGNDNLTPPPRDEHAPLPDHGRTMFGSPASVNFEALADTAPDARPVAALQSPTREVSNHHSNRLLASFAPPSAQANTRPSSDLALTPLPAQEQAPPPPPVAGAPPTRAQEYPDLGPDTMEVDDAHATAVLRDFIRDRSDTPGSSPAAGGSTPRKEAQTPLAQPALVTPPAGATVDMGAAAVGALLDAYTGSRDTVPEAEPEGSEKPVAPDTTREVGSRRASDLLSQYVKPDK
ncbi:MAG: hypothetical protein ACJAYU_004048 [Bradymonadia bacterium]